MLVATLAPLSNLGLVDFGASPVSANGCGGDSHIAVKLVDGVSIDDVNAEFETYVVQDFPPTSIYLLGMVGKTAGAMGKANALNSSEQVVWAEAGGLDSVADDFSTAIIHEFSSANISQFSTTTVNQFSQSALDQFTQTALDQFTATVLDQFTTTALDQFSTAILDPFGTSVLDQFNTTILDQFSVSILDQFGQAALDQFSSAVLDEFSTTTVDQFSVVVLDQFSQTALDRFSIIVENQFSQASLEQFVMAVADQFSMVLLDQFNMASLDGFSRSAIDQFSINMTDQFNTIVNDHFDQLLQEQFNLAALDQFSTSMLDHFGNKARGRFKAEKMDKFSQMDLDQFSTAILDQFSNTVNNHMSPTALNNASAVALAQFSQAALDQFSVAVLDGLIQNIMMPFNPAFFEQLKIQLLDTMYGSDARNQDAMAQISAAAAQQYGTGAGVVVAVIDTGIRDHWYMRDNIATNGYDYVGLDSDPIDEYDGIDDDGDGLADEGWSHGTHVAGIVTLVAPDVTIMPIRVQDADGGGWSFMSAEAIQYATDNGADIINLSLGTVCPSDVLDWAVDYAEANGVVVVAAAGNEDSTAIHFPARNNYSIAVAAVDDQDTRAPFSNYGSEVDISAPGVNIYSAYGDGEFAWWSGTSQATPMIAGGAALVLSADQTLTASQIESKLITGVDDIDALNPGYAGKLGSGRVNMLTSMTVVID